MSDHVSAEQLSLLLDGQLSLLAREAVRSHLRGCPGCAARHDQLVELTASLRLRGPLEWSPAQTEATLERLREQVAARRRLGARRRGYPRDWSLPLAGLLAFAGLTGIGFAPLGIGSHLADAPAAAVSLLPGGTFVSGHLLVALVAAVFVGLLALPLSRSR